MSDLPGTALSAYLDGELAPVDAAAVAEHLAGCPDCRRSLAELQATAELLRAAAPNPATADLAGEIQAAATRIDARRERSRVTARHALGALLLTLAGVAFSLTVLRTGPVLLGIGLLRLVGAVLASAFHATLLPAWPRLLLLALLAAGAWRSAGRLRRALRQAELRP